MSILEHLTSNIWCVNEEDKVQNKILAKYKTKQKYKEKGLSFAYSSSTIE